MPLYFVFCLLLISGFLAILLAAIWLPLAWLYLIGLFGAAIVGAVRQ